MTQEERQTCPKCSGDQVELKYEKQKVYFIPGWISFFVGTPEYIKVLCKKCGYLLKTREPDDHSTRNRPD